MKNYQATSMELPLLAVLKPPAAIEQSIIDAFGDDEDTAVKAAVLWSWAERRVKGMSGRTAAAMCGIKPQHFALIVRGRKYLPPSKLNSFEQVVGNTALRQTIDRFRSRRDDQVRRELAELVAQSMRVA